MKRTTTFIALAALALACTALSSCAKPATDAEIAQAYNFYLESPESLSKVISSSTTGNLIDEILANGDESCVRRTEINQADGTSRITITFKDYEPRSGTKVVMNGKIVITSLATLFAINGSLDYSDFRPARLVFRNATLEQIQDEAGTASFVPKEGSVLADEREIGVDEFFNKIMQ